MSKLDYEPKKPLLRTFIAEAQRARKRMLVVGLLLPALLFLAPMLIALPWMDEVQAFTAQLQRTGREMWIPMIGIAWFAVALTVIGLTERRTNRLASLRCPACGKSLLRHTAVVIASGRCCHCAAQVISDHPLGKNAG